MLIIYALPIGLLLGYVLRGRLATLASLRMRHMWLIPIALVIQLVIFLPFGRGLSVPASLFMALHLASYGLILVFLGVNLRQPPVGVIVLGALFNLLVISANSGHMPSSATALTRAGETEIVERLLTDGTFGNIVLMGTETSLNPLGDVLYLPAAIPLATAFSLGDALVAVGLVWLIARGMVADV